MLLFFLDAPFAAAPLYAETSSLVTASSAEDEAPPPGPGGPTPRQGPGPHLRFGLGLDLAALGSSSFFGLGVGVQARMGLQLSPWFAVYYQPHAIGGLVVAGDTSAGLLGAVFNSFNLELDLPILQLGLGPSIDVVALTGCSLGSGSCETGNGIYFGVDTRAALLLGPHGPGTHSGFALEANLHATFVDGDVLTTFTVGFAGEIY